MAKAQRKATRPEDAPPRSGEAWRRRPARSRKQVRRAQALVPAPPKVAIRPVAAAEPTAKRQLRLPSWGAVRQGLLVLVALAMAAGLLQLLRVPELAVSATSTEIGGADRITPAEVYRASQVEGRNILLIQPEQVAQQVAEVPGIASADVHLRLPNRVIIDVIEYSPLLAWEGVTTTVWLAANGSPVPQAGVPPALKIVDRTGETLAQSQAAWPKLLASLAELRRTHPELQELSYGTTQGLYYGSSEGWEIWLGDGEQVTGKLALLDGAKQEIAKAGVHPQVIDLRFSTKQALWW